MLRKLILFETSLFITVKKEKIKINSFAMLQDFMLEKGNTHIAKKTHILSLSQVMTILNNNQV